MEKVSQKRNDLSQPYFSSSQETPLFHFIVIDDLPEDQKEIFRSWLQGESQPVIWDGIDCAYSWDYSLWYDYWSEGKTAPKE